MDPMGLTPFFFKGNSIATFDDRRIFLKRNSESGMHIPEAKSGKVGAVGAVGGAEKTTWPQ